MAVLYVLAIFFALTLFLLALFTAYTARRVERLLPPEGRFLYINGQRLHYLDLGDGPPIVMIHGLASDTRRFTYALTRHLIKGPRYSPGSRQSPC